MLAVGSPRRPVTSKTTNDAKGGQRHVSRPFTVRPQDSNIGRSLTLPNALSSTIREVANEVQRLNLGEGRVDPLSRIINTL